MHSRELSPNLGVELLEVDASRLEPSDCEEVAKILLMRGVVLMRDQSLTTAQHVEFSRMFGALETFPVTEDSPPEDEFIFRVSNDRSRGYKGVGLYWHTDGYFHERPTAVSIMRAVEVPDNGGETGFANMALALDSLPVEIQSEIDGLEASSRPAPGAARSGLFGSEGNTGARHPLNRPHPLTGRPILYLNAGNIVAIEGKSRDETRQLVAQLSDHVEGGDFRYNHKWKPGDLLLWDNAGVAHKATIPPAGSFRLMERTSLVGNEFFGSPFWERAGAAARGTG